MPLQPERGLPRRHFSERRRSESVEYLEINVSSPVPVYLQIMDQIRRLVSEGALEAGDPLPSVRQLASELAVNPNTVAKAYQFLEMEGTIATMKRRGAFVGKGSSAQAAAARRRRLGEVVDWFIEEARRLGATEKEIVGAVSERARELGSPRGDTDSTDQGPGGAPGGSKREKDI